MLGVVLATYLTVHCDKRFGPVSTLMSISQVNGS